MKYGRYISLDAQILQSVYSYVDFIIYLISLRDICIFYVHSYSWSKFNRVFFNNPGLIHYIHVPSVIHFIHIPNCIHLFIFPVLVIYSCS